MSYMRRTKSKPVSEFIPSMYAVGGFDYTTVEKAINAAVQNERQRCSDICSAELEWGGSLSDAIDRIDNGHSPRLIEGWNAPYEDDE